MAEPIIKIENLKVIYNPGKSNEVRSLDGVSLEIFPEEYVIIYGPSGCGKSTLLYSIAGLQRPGLVQVVRTHAGRDRQDHGEGKGGGSEHGRLSWRGGVDGKQAWALPKPAKGPRTL